MTYPEHDEIAEALLCLILLNGGHEHTVRSGATYEPLADLFGLSRAKRIALRPDGREGTHWQTLVQWARQRNINRGFMINPKKVPSRRGFWKLSYTGIQQAQSVAGHYPSLRN